MNIKKPENGLMMLEVKEVLSFQVVEIKNINNLE